MVNLLFITMSSPEDPLQKVLLESFSAICGISALHFVLDSMDDEEREGAKEMVIQRWKSVWREGSREEIAAYNEVLGQFKNSHLAMQPEEIQVEFNRGLAYAEKIARAALDMEDAE